MRNALLLATAVLSGCSTMRREAPANTVELSGRIEGDEVDLAFKLSGRVSEILVREGDTVKAGQVVARLSGDQEIARLREAEARLAGARSRVAQAKLSIPTLESRVATARIATEQAEQDAPSRVEQAEAQAAAARAEAARVEAEAAQANADAERYAGLAETGAAPKQTAEQAASRARAMRAGVEAARRQVTAADQALQVARATLRNPAIRSAERETLARQVEEARAGVRLAETEVAAAEAALERARADVVELELRAPSDGTVITRTSEPGRVVAAGATILTVVDMSGLYLRGFIPEGQIGRVKIAQPAQVFLDSAPDQPIEAEVMRIDPQAMFTPENTYFREDRVKQVVGVKLRLKGGFGYAKPGMPADGRIRVDGSGNG
jgi:HlyD family secretion protein